MNENENPLSDEEIKEIRELLVADRRAKWLWAGIRTWAIWITAVVTGATVFWDSVTHLIHVFLNK